MSKSKISSDYLFHYTQKLEAIKGILENGFRVNEINEPQDFLYHPLQDLELENMVDDNITHDELFKRERSQDISLIEKSIKMICFCDLLPSQVKEHKEDYGEYAFALKKEWGLSRGINPVFYINVDLELKSSIAQYLTIWYRSSINSNKYQQNKELINFIVSNLKNYEGRNPINGKRKRFYDERE